MADFREDIHTLEKRVEKELDIENISAGYKYGNLFKYMQNKKKINKDIRKKLYEYATFLHILPEWLKPSELTSEEKISFTPSSGKGAMLSCAPSLFVEPHLPPYPEKKIWNEYKQNYNYLQSPTEGEVTYHTRPDILLTAEDTNKLPWTAKPAPQPVEQSKLMEMCANMLFEEVSEKIGADEVPSSYAECSSLVQTEAEKESTSELYEMWNEFGRNAEYVIECKHEPLSKSDYSQILWYGLVYNTDIVIVSKYRIGDSKFLNDIKNIDVNVDIISADVIDDIEKARSRVSKAIQ